MFLSENLMYGLLHMSMGGLSPSSPRAPSRLYRTS